MYRVEIMSNQSLEEDIKEAFAQNNVAKAFTMIPNVQGQGNSFPKEGNEIWPEENILFIIYCEKEEFDQLTAVINNIKAKNKQEGVKMFSVSYQET